MHHRQLQKQKGNKHECFSKSIFLNTDQTETHFPYLHLPVHVSYRVMLSTAELHWESSGFSTALPLLLQALALARQHHLQSLASETILHLAFTQVSHNRETDFTRVCYSSLVCKSPKAFKGPGAVASRGRKHYVFGVVRQPVLPSRVSLAQTSSWTQG